VVLPGKHIFPGFRGPSWLFLSENDSDPTLMQQSCLTSERYADHVESAYVDNAAYFTDTARWRSLDWLQKAR